MDLKTTGGHAFPTADSQTAHGIAVAAIAGIEDSAERDRMYSAVRAQAQQGMTLRDYFAAQALAGIEGSQGNNGNFVSTVEKVAARAYELADAMLVARSAA